MVPLPANPAFWSICPDSSSIIRLPYWMRATCFYMPQACVNSASSTWNAVSFSLTHKLQLNSIVLCFVLVMYLLTCIMKHFSHKEKHSNIINNHVPTICLKNNDIFPYLPQMQIFSIFVMNISNIYKVESVVQTTHTSGTEFQQLLIFCHIIVCHSFHYYSFPTPTHIHTYTKPLNLG